MDLWIDLTAVVYYKGLIRVYICALKAIKELTLIVLQGSYFAFCYFVFILNKAVWKVFFLSFCIRACVYRCVFRLCLRFCLTLSRRAARCFRAFSVLHSPIESAYRWVYVHLQLHLSPYSMCRVPFSLTRYRQGCWPCASGSCTRADVLALRA